MARRNELRHYASPYYDPVKAHEYYMQHRVLKGRKSTASLNEKGKAAARYVKEQITNEKKSKITQNSETQKTKIKSERTSYKERHKVANEALKSNIKNMREKLKNMDPFEKDEYRDRMNDEIEAMRARNKEIWDQARTVMNSKIESIRETHKGIRESIKKDYENRYLSELDKIRATPEFLKKKKGG